MVVEALDPARNRQYEDPGFIVNVDRSKKPEYPIIYVKRLIHPELENTGPGSYDLRDLDRLSVESAEASTVYVELKKIDAIKDCLGFSDLLAINDNPNNVRIFLRLFKDTGVYGWKSVVEDGYGVMRVPRLHKNLFDDELVIDWEPLTDVLNPKDIALKFPPSNSIKTE